MFADFTMFILDSWEAHAQGNNEIFKVAEEIKKLTVAAQNAKENAPPYSTNTLAQNFIKAFGPTKGRSYFMLVSKKAKNFGKNFFRRVFREFIN